MSTIHFDFFGGALQILGKAGFRVFNQNSLRWFLGIAFVFFFGRGTIYAQEVVDRCATRFYGQGKDERQKSIEFEQWIEKKMAEKAVQNKTNRRKRLTTDVKYKIPVVVHVVHNGEPVGIGSNISDEQVISQINTINLDYNRQNADALNTRDEFLSVAGALHIEFVLAKRDPNGHATNGIVRVKGLERNYSRNSLDNLDQKIKTLSYWPAENYLNMWVAELGDNLFGYASFPDTKESPDENPSHYSRLIDGIIINRRCFGSIRDNMNFNLFENLDLGRVATHEIGHFLGLFHLWGNGYDYYDQMCGTDYVEDTPTQFNKTWGCPGEEQYSCGSSDMYENYMDYSDDACTNMFTQGQVERMKAVLDASPRRKSLLTSPGLEKPSNAFYDLHLLDFSMPLASCSETTNTVLAIENLSNESVYKFQVTITDENGGVILNQKVNSAPILEGEVRKISLITNFPFLQKQSNYTIAISKPNEEEDQNPDNNSIILGAVYNTNQEKLPLSENFDGNYTAVWSALKEPYAIWESRSTNYNHSLQYTVDKSSANNAAWLVSPVLNLKNLDKASLTFEMAYPTYIAQGDQKDSLKIFASLDCGKTYEAKPIYSKSLSSLTNVTRAGIHEALQWQREYVSLTPYVNQENIRLALTAKGPNNFLIDNINFYTDENPPNIRLNNDWYRIYGVDEKSITFKLPKRETAQIDVYKINGTLISSQNFQDVLNQTYRVQLPKEAKGIYVVRIKTDSSAGASRIFIP